jgi:hypothetical protein
VKRLFKIVGIGFGVVVGLVLIMAIVGLYLPTEASMGAC